MSEVKGSNQADNFSPFVLIVVLQLFQYNKPESE